MRCVSVGCVSAESGAALLGQRQGRTRGVLKKEYQRPGQYFQPTSATKSAIFGHPRELHHCTWATHRQAGPAYLPRGARARFRQLRARPAMIAVMSPTDITIWISSRIRVWGDNPPSQNSGDVAADYAEPVQCLTLGRNFAVLRRVWPVARTARECVQVIRCKSHGTKVILLNQTLGSCTAWIKLFGLEEDVTMDRPESE